MRSEGAKNIMILMLIVINLTLSGFSLWNSKENSLSQAHVDSIFSVLSKNNISMYTELPRNFKPMKAMKLEPWRFSEEEIFDIFFEGESRIVMSSDDSTDFYTLGYTTLKFEKSENMFYYDAPIVVDDIDAFCDGFTSRINLKGSKLVLDNVSEGGKLVEYRVVYKEFIIYDSFIRLEFSESGLVKIRLSMFTPTGFDGDARSIYSADEALFNLMFRLKSDSIDDETIKIVKMDVVYCLDETGEEMAQTATPYYRLYILYGNREIQNEPYLVNIYNNNIKR